MTEMRTADAPPGSATDALVERLFLATVDTLEIASVHLGGRLGFYRALADGGQATPGELAARTGTTERYVREWLEQQAVAGFLAVDNPDATTGERRYRLPAEHRPVFVEEEDLNYLTPLATLAIAVCGPMEALLDAYRTGGGVPYEAYDLHEAVGAINRPQYVHLAGTGSPRFQRSTHACARSRPPVSPTSPAGRPGRASPSPAPIQD
jgi:hypothetical protein